MTFTAEKTDTGDQLFATQKVNASSIHYPLSKIVWGADSGTFNQTDTSTPLPVNIFGDSGHPVFVRGVGSSRVPIISDSGNAIHVRGLTDSAINVQNTSATAIFIKAESGSTTIPVAIGGDGSVSIVAGSTMTVSFTANSTLAATVTTASGAAVHVRGLTDSHVAITSDSGDPIFVRGLTDSHVTVGQTDSSFPIRIVGESGSTSITVTGAVTTSTDITITNIDGNDTTVTVTGSSVVVLNGSSVVTGAALSTQIALDSTAKTITTAATRLYGYSLFNPDTAVPIWAKIFQDDSGGVTLGTTEPMMNLMMPPLGGLNLTIPQGINMSSGLSIATSDLVASTGHTAPTTVCVFTAIYTPST